MVNMVNIWFWGEVLPKSNVIWLVIETYPSEKYELVSWDDGIPNIWNNKIHVPNHQPDYNLGTTCHDFLALMKIKPYETCNVWGGLQSTSGPEWTIHWARRDSPTVSSVPNRTRSCWTACRPGPSFPDQALENKWKNHLSKTGSFSQATAHTKTMTIGSQCFSKVLRHTMALERANK